jgi:hypothetical protein
MNNFLSIWKQLAHEKKLTRYDMAFYCLSKALLEYNKLQLQNDYNTQGPSPTQKSLAIRLLQQSFTPVTKPIKLANGARPYGSLEDSLFLIKRFLTCMTQEPKLINFNYSHSQNNLIALGDTMTPEELVSMLALCGQLYADGKVDLL